MRCKNGRTRHLAWIPLTSLILCLAPGCAIGHTERVEKQHTPAGMIDEKGRHVVEEGSNSPAVVLLHGCPGSLHDYNYAVGVKAPLRSLLKNRHRVFTLDLPGHGYDESIDARASIDEQLDWLHAALRDYGIKSPVLVGYSWSGALALLYAQSYGDELKGVVLLSPIAYAATELSDDQLGLLDIPILGDIAMLFVGGPVAAKEIRKRLAVALAPQTIPAGYLKYCADMWSRPKELRVIHAHNKSMHAALQESERDHVKITVPVVIITGMQDAVVNPRRHAERLSRALQLPADSWIKLPGTGHAVHFRHPDIVVKKIEELQEQ